ncbi:MAG TPA: DNA-binding response regulator [Deltaproteobacteria bacterium]|nr:MAG: DNA-binding response regulator [Deltaproteobacteria bacterium GWA2_45_12]HBF12038.1 DNA-binding response regulator [Deltaproteobacteria bacterium]
MKVVIIEDEPDIAELVRYNLQKEGYKPVIAKDGFSGLKLVKNESPDIVLLDVMLPGMDGIEVCRKLKSDAVTRSIPVIMMTAKGEESDVVLGLGVGADDYVKKPFSPKELLARVKAVLRRINSLQDEDAKDRIELKDLVIDLPRHEVKVGGTPIVLTATEFRLIHFLASHPGRVFSREQLLNRVIGEDAVVVDRNIDVHIRVIRKKLGKKRDLIETIRGVGYKFGDE